MILEVSSFECASSAFNIIDENSSFSISTPSHWNSEDSEDLINKFDKILELRSENDKELHIREVGQRSDQIIIGEDEYLILSDLDREKGSIIKELKRIKSRDLEDMVCRLQITYGEIVDILDVKYVTGSTKRYILPPIVFEVSDIILMLKSLLPDEIKVNNTVDNYRLESKLPTNEKIRFTKRALICTVLGFFESHLGVLGDINGFVQLIPGNY